VGSPVLPIAAPGAPFLANSSKPGPRLVYNRAKGTLIIMQKFPLSSVINNSASAETRPGITTDEIPVFEDIITTSHPARLLFEIAC
jgi:hypothetical protein